MEKKKYEHPVMESVKVQLGTHLLEGSPIGKTDPNLPPDSRQRSSWSDDED